MADIPLRTYVEQLDNLIERKQVDEVIAHCRHILSLYSKHLDTYRMLGKALLEKGRHGDAADIFQRVLSVMPDDFISHVGMSIVREDEANLDSAIWHMERAFEAAPANGAIQQELCRLYGRRDGVAPVKARLTRGALARMYAQGGLYLQAEAELKAALAAETDRIDLMTKLADVYLQTDQPAQAAQTSAAILQKLPYSIDANRILVSIFRAQGRPNDAAVYRQRLEALDPYEAFADPAADGAGAAQVDRAKVMVARLDYVPGMEDTGSPDWLASIGAQFEESAAAHTPEAQPDWLSAASEAVQAAPAADYQPGQGSVPDWLKDLEAGSSGTAPAGQPSGAPDWLRDMQAATGQLKAAPSDSGDELPEWLVTATGPLPADAVPDWMLASGESAATTGADAGTAPLSASGEAVTVPASPAADNAAVPTPSASAAEPGGELPDWLKATVADETEADLPDWLKAITAQPLPVAETPVEQPALPAAEVHDLLESSAPDAGQAQAPSPLAEPTLVSTGSLPDWLKEATSEPDSSKLPAPGELAATAPSAAMDAAPAPAVMDTATAAAEAETLIGITLPPKAEERAPAAEPPAPEELPDWLKAAALVGGSVAAAATSEQAAATEQMAAAPASAPTLEAAAEPQAAADAAIPWQPQATEEPEAEPVNLTAGAVTEPPTIEPLTGAELPDWLQAATAVPAQDEIPVWLQTAPAAPGLAAAPASEEPGVELPDWLKEVAVGAPSPDASTAVLVSEPVAAQVPEDATPSTAPPPVMPPVELPDYLQLASPEAIARAKAPLDLEPEAEPEETEPFVLPADIPDWLKALAPSPDPSVPAAAQPTFAAAEASAASDTGDSLGWLDELTAGAAAPTLTPAGEPASDEVPAWLAAPELAAPEAPAAVPGGLGQDTLGVEIPPWAQNEEPGPSDTIASWLAGKHVPDWLRQPAHDAPAQPAVDWEPNAELASAQLPSVDSLAASAAPAEQEAQPEPTAPAEPAAAQALESMDAEETFRWLESLAAQQGARSEELFTTPKAIEDTASTAPMETQPAPEPAAQAAIEPTPPALEPPSPTAETPAPTEFALAEPGGLEDFLRQAEAAIPVEHLADTAPTKKELAAEAPTTPEAAPEPAPSVSPSLAAPVPATAAEQPPPSGDFDAEAALRWLEGLAAQQGANPEELLTAPEERTLEAPHWVRAEQAASDQTLPAAVPAEPSVTAAESESTPFMEAAEASTPLALVETTQAESFAAPAETAAQAAEAPAMPMAEAVPAATPEAPAPDAEAEAALRWLEGLAARQGANPDELLTAPEERTLEAPDWVATHAEAAAAEGVPVSAEAEAEPEVTAEAAPAAAPETPEWLKAFVPAEERVETTPPVPVAAEAPSAEPEPAASPEVPDWLKTLTPTEEPAEATPPAPLAVEPSASAESVVPPPMAATADLDKLSRLSERLAAARHAREAEMEARFAEQRSQQEAARRLVEQRLEVKRAEQEQASRPRQTGPLPPLAEPKATPPPAVEQPAVEELAPTVAPTSAPPAATPVTRQHPRPAIRVQRPRPAQPAIAPVPTPAAVDQTPTPAATAAPVEPDEALARGQAALSGQDYEGAVKHFSGLVEQGHHLDVVVTSLEGVVKGGPAPVPVLQLLGDAYLRTDQLQPALDAYRQALNRL